jgi:hypothetical protein
MLLMAPPLRSPRLKRFMDRAEDDIEKTLAEIHALTARLTALLQEAEALRARVGKARGANVWPDVPPGFWLPPREGNRGGLKRS